MRHYNPWLLPLLQGSRGIGRTLAVVHAVTRTEVAVQLHILAVQVEMLTWQGHRGLWSQPGHCLSQTAAIDRHTSQHEPSAAACYSLAPNLKPLVWLLLEAL